MTINLATSLPHHTSRPATDCYCSEIPLSFFPRTFWIHPLTICSCDFISSSGRSTGMDGVLCFSEGRFAACISTTSYLTSSALPLSTFRPGNQLPKHQSIRSAFQAPAQASFFLGSHHTPHEPLAPHLQRCKSTFLVSASQQLGLIVTGVVTSLSVPSSGLFLLFHGRHDCHVFGFKDALCYIGVRYGINIVNEIALCNTRSPSRTSLTLP